jgi:citronellol/citronellal dehydrogenase
MSLNGKTVFITGSTRGIGRAIALRCARDGANIIVTGKSKDPHPKLAGTLDSVAAEVVACGGQALTVQLDVRRDDEVNAAMELAADKFGGIDILVNNASAISLTSTLDTTMKKFDLMMSVNARAAFSCSRAALPYLLKSDHPHILNMSPPLSLDSKWFKDFMAYTYAKFGMSMCTLGMAAEFKDRGVAINSLWPKTTIDTDAVRVHFPEHIVRSSRTTAIVADAAYEILTMQSFSSGNFYIDEDVLRNAGISDFASYSVDPSIEPYMDLYIDV